MCVKIDTGSLLCVKDGGEGQCYLSWWQSVKLVLWSSRASVLAFGSIPWPARLPAVSSVVRWRQWTKSLLTTGQWATVARGVVGPWASHGPTDQTQSCVCFSYFIFWVSFAVLLFLVNLLPALFQPTCQPINIWQSITSSTYSDTQSGSAQQRISLGWKPLCPTGKWTWRDIFVGL